MPVYRHECRTCKLEWDEEYTLAVYEWYKEQKQNRSCPECEGEDTFIQVCDTLPIKRPGGVGWADSGYYNYSAYDKHLAEGKSVKLYDRKEDIDRDMRGEAEQAEKARLKKVDEAARRHMSPDAGLTQVEADAKIKAAGQRAVDR